MSDVCDVAELIVARSVERQLLADRQVALEFIARGADLHLPSVVDVDVVLEEWLGADSAQLDVEDGDRLVLLRALGVRP